LFVSEKIGKVRGFFGKWWEISWQGKLQQESYDTALAESNMSKYLLIAAEHYQSDSLHAD
jgi:hypothetical protein